MSMNNSRLNEDPSPFLYFLQLTGASCMSVHGYAHMWAFAFLFLYFHLRMFLFFQDRYQYRLLAIEETNNRYTFAVKKTKKKTHSVKV